MRDKYTEDICHSATLEGYLCVYTYINIKFIFMYDK